MRCASHATAGGRSSGTTTSVFVSAPPAFESPVDAVLWSQHRMGKGSDESSFVVDGGPRRSSGKQYPFLSKSVFVLARYVITTTDGESNGYCSFVVAVKRYVSGYLKLAPKVTSELNGKRRQRHQDNRRYPWARRPDENRCNFAMNVGTTTTVGMYPMGISPYQCHDMSGNVWEWTSSLWGKDPMDPEFGYPYDAGDGREGLSAADSVRRVLRGGVFYRVLNLMRCASRNGWRSLIRDDDLGFRVCAPGL